MHNYGDRNPKKTIRESTEYQKFFKALSQGFVVKKDAQDKDSVTNPDLLDCSDSIAALLFKGTGFQQKKDTVNQFRKFFNEVNGLKKLRENASKLGVELRLLRARMSYAVGRQTISEDFSIVINDCIDTIIKQGDLKTQIQGFCNVFEALYAYYHYHTKVRAN